MQLTQQEIFDKVAIHLLTQNARSGQFDDTGTFCCKYRSDNGDKCAVGVLIPDDAYDAIAEGIGAFVALNDQHCEGEELAISALRGMLTAGGVDTTSYQTMNMLASLQYMHDDMAVEQWDDALRSLAKTLKLSAEVVDNFRKETDL